MMSPDVSTTAPSEHRRPDASQSNAPQSDAPQSDGPRPLAIADDILRGRARLPPTHPERQRLRNLAVEVAAPTARSLARRFAGRGEPLADIQQVAYVGLLKAVDGFDPRYPDFCAYAVPTITGEIKRYFRDNSWAVEIPRRYKDLGGAVSQCRDQLTQELRQVPAVADFARHLGADDEEIRRAIIAWQAYNSVSLFEPSARGDGDRLADRIGESEPGYERVDAYEVIHPALARLPLRERQIITMRYFDNMTQSQIGAVVGLSQMQVSRLLARSLEMLRCVLNDGTEDRPRCSP